MKNKLDHIVYGLLGGIICSLLGFVIFGFGWAYKYDASFTYFIEEAWVKTTMFRNKIITVSVLFNVVVFAFMLKYEMYQFAKGIVGVILISVPIIIYYS
jgi:uncharacterized membrane protein